MSLPDDELCSTSPRRPLTSVAGMTDSSSPGTKTTAWHVALLGGYRRRGAWQVPARTIAISPVGGIDLDLTEATLPEGGATVIKVSLVGGVKLKVPADKLPLPLTIRAPMQCTKVALW